MRVEYVSAPNVPCKGFASHGMSQRGMKAPPGGLALTGNRSGATNIDNNCDGVVDGPLADSECGSGVGCRMGYACLWAGVRAAGTTNSGGCFPGNYNSIRTPNIGAACTMDSQCYSPYGHGLCANFGGTLSGYCTVADCAELPGTVCGSGGDCLPTGTDFSLCFEACITSSTCASGFTCQDADGDPGTTGDSACLPG